MSGVKPSDMVDKLHHLNSTQQSIETVSAWCRFYRKDARKIVSIWEGEFVKMTVPKQLGMLYLANDILQNSRKKGPEFVHEFYRILPRAVKHLLKHGDEKAKRAASRLVEIWEDRKVFGNSGTRPFRDLAAEAETPKGTSSGPAYDQPAAAVPPKFLPLEALANAVSEVKAISDRNAEYANMVVGLDENIVKTNDQSELLAASQLLKAYTSSLEAQISQHRHTARMLQALQQEQEAQAQDTESQLESTRVQQQLILERLASTEAAAQLMQQPAHQFPPVNLHQQPAAAQQLVEDDIDMEFDPPGSAMGGDANTAFGSAHSYDQNGNAQKAGNSLQGASGQPQELYSPSFSAQPSGLSDLGFQGGGDEPPLPGAQQANTQTAPLEGVSTGEAPIADAFMLQALRGFDQSQLDAIQANLANYQQPQLPGQQDLLSADQLTNSVNASEEYDPEELYDPSENL